MRRALNRCYRHLLLMLYPLDLAGIIGTGLESRDWTEPWDGSPSGNNTTWRSAGRAERRSRCTGLRALCPVRALRRGQAITADFVLARRRDITAAVGAAMLAPAGVALPEGSASLLPGRPGADRAVLAPARLPTCPRTLCAVRGTGGQVECAIDTAEARMVLMGWDDAEWATAAEKAHHHDLQLAAMIGGGSRSGLTPGLQGIGLAVVSSTAYHLEAHQLCPPPEVRGPFLGQGRPFVVS